jgi:hypothetical protein
MSIKEFTVGVRHVVNLGNYETMHIEAAVTVNVEDADWIRAREEAQGSLTWLLFDCFEKQANPAWFSQIANKRNRKP